MSETNLSRERAVTVLVTVGTVIVFAAGIWVGRFLAGLPARGAIGAWDHARTLGSLVRSRDRKGKALAYKDPGRALAEMDGYAWVPPNAPAPFLGSIAAAGRWDSAVIGPLGIRDARPLERSKPAGVQRVFLLGGSTAFGVGAPSGGETIGGLLEAELVQRFPDRKIEVRTLANPAWCTTHERIAIENLVSELEPDLVISFTGVNDVHWGELGRNVLWFRAYWDQAYFDALQSAYRLAGRQFPEDPVPASAGSVEIGAVVRRFEQNVWLGAQALRRIGVRYVVALQPQVFSTRKRLSSREVEQRGKLSEERQKYFRDAYRAILARMQAPAPGEQSVSFVDLSGVFDEMGPDSEVFLDSFHFGDRGNEIIAGRLAEAVKGELEGRAGPGR